MPEVRLNPKHIRAMKDGKAPLEYLVTSVDAGDAFVLKGGADKYGVRNWLIDKILATTYVGAIRRHFNAWIGGEDLDPDSGYHHFHHIRACCAIVLDAEKHGMLIDDRGRQESISADGGGTESSEPLTTVMYTHSYINENGVEAFPKTKTFGPFATRAAANEFVRQTQGQIPGIVSFNTLLPILTPETENARIRNQETNDRDNDADRITADNTVTRDSAKSIRDNYRRQGEICGTGKDS